MSRSGFLFSFLCLLSPAGHPPAVTLTRDGIRAVPLLCLGFV